MARWERKFDYDTAKLAYGLGTPVGEIAHQHGVSTSAIRRVVVPGKREQMAQASKRWYRSGTCPDCGHVGTVRRSTWVDLQGHQADNHSGLSADEMRAHGYLRQVVESRCEPCKAAHNAHLVKQRIRHGRRQLWCPGCKHWKADDDFYPSLKRRHRARRPYCKRCETRQRREHRHRQAEEADE